MVVYLIVFIAIIAFGYSFIQSISIFANIDYSPLLKLYINSSSINENFISLLMDIFIRFVFFVDINDLSTILRMYI